MGDAMVSDDDMMPAQKRSGERSSSCVSKFSLAWSSCFSFSRSRVEPDVASGTAAAPNSSSRQQQQRQSVRSRTVHALPSQETESYGWSCEPYAQHVSKYGSDSSFLGAGVLTAPAAAPSVPLRPAAAAGAGPRSVSSPLSKLQLRPLSRQEWLPAVDSELESCRRALSARLSALSRSQTASSNSRLMNARPGTQGSVVPSSCWRRPSNASGFSQGLSTRASNVSISNVSTGGARASNVSLGGVLPRFHSKSSVTPSIAAGDATTCARSGDTTPIVGGGGKGQDSCMPMSPAVDGTSPCTDSAGAGRGGGGGGEGDGDSRPRTPGQLIHRISPGVPATSPAGGASYRDYGSGAGGPSTSRKLVHRVSSSLCVSAKSATRGHLFGPRLGKCRALQLLVNTQRAANLVFRGGRSTHESQVALEDGIHALSKNSSPGCPLTSADEPTGASMTASWCRRHQSTPGFGSVPEDVPVPEPHGELLVESTCCQSSPSNMQ